MKKFNVLFTVFTLVVFTACGKPVNTTSLSNQQIEEAGTESSGTLNIAVQGIFLVGGILQTSEGVFNPEDQFEKQFIYGL